MAQPADRLAALHAYRVLDTREEPVFEALARLAADLFDTPIAVISLLDEQRQWFKSCIGLEVRETPIEQAFCLHTLDRGREGVFVVEDAERDARFADNPLVTAQPHIRFYAGAALTSPEGVNFGALCVIDHKPRAHPTAAALARLQDLVRRVVQELEHHKTYEALKEGQRLLRLSEAMSGVGHWRFETHTGRIAWSEEVYRIHGVEPGVFEPDYERVIGFYHPDDQQVLNALVERGAPRVVDTSASFA